MARKRLETQVEVDETGRLRPLGKKPRYSHRRVVGPDKEPETKTVTVTVSRVEVNAVLERLAGDDLKNVQNLQRRLTALRNMLRRNKGRRKSAPDDLEVKILAGALYTPDPARKFVSTGPKGGGKTGGTGGTGATGGSGGRGGSGGSGRPIP